MRDIAEGGGAIEADVEIAGAGSLDGGDAGEIAARDPFGELLRELLRDDFGRFAEAFGELEGDGGSELAEGDMGGLLDGDVRELEVVDLGKDGLDGGDEILLDCAIHAWAITGLVLRFSLRDGRVGDG